MAFEVPSFLSHSTEEMLLNSDKVAFGIIAVEPSDRGSVAFEQSCRQPFCVMLRKTPHFQK